MPQKRSAQTDAITDITLQVEVDGDLIIVTQPETQFIAIYARPSVMPQLILRKRTEGEDYELFARAWQEANMKARELGWIV